jgi:hypothetical protein
MDMNTTRRQIMAGLAELLSAPSFSVAAAADAKAAA